MPRKPAPRTDTEIRTDAEIMADAIKVLAPRAGEYEKRHKLLTKCMRNMRIITRCGDVKAPTLTEVKEQLDDSCKKLKAARAVLVAMGSPKELIEEYDSQLHVAENNLLGYQRAAAHPNMRNVRFASREPNMVAACAAAMARDLLLESGQRVRWKQWHRLSALLYEAATGKYGFNCSKYMSGCQSGQIVRSRPAGGYF